LDPTIVMRTFWPLAAALAAALAFTPTPAAGQPAKRPAPVAASPSPSPSAPGVTPEELEEIERQLGPDAEPDGVPSVPPALLPSAQGLSAGSLMNPNISLILDVAAAAFSDPAPMQLGGHDPRRNGFNLQQLELSMGSAVDPYLRFDSNIVFSQFGVEIEEAYATTLDLPLNLQARAGQFLTRFGRINNTHPHAWDFADQPLVIGKFMGAEGNRGLGAEASWLVPLPWYGELVGSLTDATGGASARSFYGNAAFDVLSPLDTQATLAFKQFFPLGADWSLAWGLSGASGPNPTGRANRSDLFGTDLYLKYRPLSGGSFTEVAWTTEMIARRRQVPDRLLADYGGYSSLFWRFAPQWGTAARYELVSGAANDYLDPEWVGDRSRVSADVTFWPTEFSRLRWQVSMDRPSWRPEPIYGTFITLETVIGAHGAHHF
jgi:hypothetical protein